MDDFFDEKMVAWLNRENKRLGKADEHTEKVFDDFGQFTAYFLKFLHDSFDDDTSLIMFGSLVAGYLLDTAKNMDEVIARKKKLNEQLDYFLKHLDKGISTVRN